MLVNDYLLKARDSRVDGLGSDAIKRTLNEIGYFPEANIIPPFFETNITSSGNTSESTSKPITHFVTKSSQQWRDFKLVRPENYTHTVDLISDNYDKIQMLLKQPKHIMSYSNPFTYDTYALRSGHQIAEWARVQRQLLSNSSKYRLPYLMQIDLQSCYHTLYTHCIEWAMESIGQKNLGNKLDKSIRRGNDNHTHGLPVGQFTTDIIAEIVLTWMDTKLEAALANIDCMGFRFKDNYYFLCRDLGDAQLCLATMATELRNSHFTVNDSKTSICPFSEYYSARWQSEYDLLLESLQLNDDGIMFTNRKLKVFIEQSVNLSLKYKNEKSILEKAITLLTNSKFEGHIDYKWLFYAISNMLPLRTLSYPKLIAFMKKITYENLPALQEDYDSFFQNELLFAVNRRDVFALIWIAYLLKDTTNQELKKLTSDSLESLKNDSPLVGEAIKYFNDDGSEPILWEDNVSRLKFSHKQYMSPGELHEYLGVSFGES